MKKEETIDQLIKCGVLAVLRAPNKESALLMANAILPSGVKGLEITYTIPKASEVIQALREDKRFASCLIGAGTVLDKETAKDAILHGAMFIVSPSFDDGVANIAKQENIPYFAGCLTPTEIVKALRGGADLIKIFPGDVVGPHYLKDIHGPLPEAKLLPSGGVSIENAGEWIKNGAVMVSAGGSLTAPAKDGNYPEITKRAKRFLEEVQKARALLK